MCYLHSLRRVPDSNPPELDEAYRFMRLNVAVEDWLLTIQIQDPDLLNIVAVLKSQKYSSQKTQLKKDYSLVNERIDRKQEGKTKFVVPKSIYWRVVKFCHNDVGHFGIEKTIQRIQHTLHRASSVITIGQNLVRLKARCISANPNLSARLI